MILNIVWASAEKRFEIYYKMVYINVSWCMYTCTSIHCCTESPMNGENRLGTRDGTFSINQCDMLSSICLPDNRYRMSQIINYQRLPVTRSIIF